MSEQLDLLSYQLTSAELAEPEPEHRSPAPSRLNRCEIEWLDAKQFYYLRLIACFVEAGIRDKEKGNADPARQAMRRREVARLSQMRSVILKQIEFLEGAEDIEL